MADHHCDCKAQGPALMPVRYTVAPDHQPGSLPGWATSGAAKYPEHENYHYALRAIRRGFLYIYYPFLSKWDAWSISDDGSLWKQFSPDNAIKKSEPDCKQGTYDQGGKDFITLPTEVLDNDIWIAFSQSPWTVSTLERYQKESERIKRMQCLSSAQWTTPTAGPCAGEATQANISAILDYMPAGASGLTPAAILPWGTHGDFRVSHVTNEGSYSLVTKVQPLETIYPWKEVSSGLAASTAQQMKQRGVKADGTPATPLIFALHDSVGVAHELTGWTDDVLALPKIFGDERALEFSTQSLINGAEQIITKTAEQKVAERLDEMMSDVKTHGTPEFIEIYTAQMEGQKDIQDKFQIANDLAKYKRMLNQEKLDSFVKCADTLIKDVDKQVKSIIAFRVKWLQNANFIATGQDFYSKEPDDNLAFREITAFAIAGINIADAGKALLDEWINAYTTKNEANLVWRTHFYNNPELMAEGEPLLMLCQQCGTQAMTEKGFIAFFEANASRLNKIFYGFETATLNLATPPGENALLSARVIYRIDQYMATVGTRMFSSFRVGAALDTMSDAVNRTLFSLAAGKSAAQTKAFFATYFGWVNQRRAYLDGVGFFNPAKLRAEDSLRVASKKFTEMDNAHRVYAQADDGKFVYKASSIRILVLLFNAAEIFNQWDQSKGDFTSGAQIASAAFATLSGMAGIVDSGFEKGIAPKLGISGKNGSLYIKMTGAGSLMIASVLSVSIDGLGFYTNEKSKSGKELWVYRGLYFAKFLNDIATALDSGSKLMAALTERFGWREAEGMVRPFLGRLGAAKFAFLGIEWIGFLSSWWVGVIIMLADYIISEYFIHNELQNWFEQGIFGKGNTEGSEDLQPEKMASLIDKSRNSLTAALYKMSNPQYKNMGTKPIMLWPVTVYDKSEDLGDLKV